jgi:hypothetical protein
LELIELNDWLNEKSRRGALEISDEEDDVDDEDKVPADQITTQMSLFKNHIIEKKQNE